MQLLRAAHAVLGATRGNQCSYSSGFVYFGPLLARCAAREIPFDATSNYSPNASPSFMARALSRGQACAFRGLPAPACRGSTPHWIPAIVLLREIREQGYEGGYSILTSFLLTLKTETTETVVRFEAEPGEQMQVDFTVIRRGRDPLLAFVATLGWSRASYVVFSRREDSAAWCSGIEKALRFFGGTPRKLLFDNVKTIIQERDVYGPGEH